MAKLRVDSQSKFRKIFEGYKKQNFENSYLAVVYVACRANSKFNKIITRNFT